MFRSSYFKKHTNYEIDPDEIFLDSGNLPEYNTFQFEGRLEKPITKRMFVFLSVFFLAVGALFVWKLVVLQVEEGGAYQELAENNRLHHTILFSERGIIVDRNG